MREPKLNKKGRAFVRLAEKVGFTVLTTTLGLVAFFTGHPIIAFAMTVWACWECRGAFKAWFRYSEIPTVDVTIVPNATDNETEEEASMHD